MTRYLTKPLPVALALCLAITPLGYAETRVQVPAGTQVPLAFMTRVDSGAAREGEAVAFVVASDVLAERQAVIRKGATAQGLIVSVAPPGIFGRNARVHIAFLQVVAADGLPIKLAPIDITPDNLREARDTAGAAGASVAGLIILGPIGVAAGALVRGGHVVVPPGAVAVTSTVAASQVALP